MNKLIIYPKILNLDKRSRLGSVILKIVDYKIILTYSMNVLILKYLTLTVVQE